MKTPPTEQIKAMRLNDYFAYIARLMKTNPPKVQDAPMLATLASIGLIPGNDFDSSKRAALDEAAAATVPQLAAQRILERFKNVATINGWLSFGPSVGDWGTDYLFRALCNMLGPGWNLPAMQCIRHPRRRQMARRTTATVNMLSISRRARCRQLTDFGR